MKERILFVVESCFYPVRDGSSERYYTWLQYLYKIGLEVHFLSFNGRKRKWDKTSLDFIKKYVKSFFIINRYQGILISLVKVIIQIAAQMITGKRYSSYLIDKIFHRSYLDKIQSYIEKNSIDTIIVNKINAAMLMGFELIKESNVLKIIDIQDIHSNHYRLHNNLLTHTPLKEFVFGNYSKFILSKFKTIIFPNNYANSFAEEMEILSIFNVILATSLDEQKRLQNNINILNKIKYLPPYIRDKNIDLSFKNNKKFDFGFIGSAAILNFEAIIFFKESIIPEIQKIKPDFRCLIGGSICKVTRSILKGENYIFIDPVDNVDTFYNKIKVVVVPLLSGTGVSIKTLEAMSYGCPIISTSAGIRGLDLTHGYDVMIEDDPKKFASTLISLLDNESLIHNLGLNALKTSLEKYSFERHHEILSSVITRH
ncbi:glycosyltransferase family 4 protein [Thermodesulfobacteriota bacterium]